MLFQCVAVRVERPTMLGERLPLLLECPARPLKSERQVADRGLELGDRGSRHLSPPPPERAPRCRCLEVVEEGFHFALECPYPVRGAHLLLWSRLIFSLRVVVEVLCPGNHESAGKRRSGKARKGDAALRAALCC
jgi:hypothetical protein